MSEWILGSTWAVTDDDRKLLLKVSRICFPEKSLLRGFCLREEEKLFLKPKLTGETDKSSTWWWWWFTQAPPPKNKLVLLITSAIRRKSIQNFRTRRWRRRVKSRGDNVSSRQSLSFAFFFFLFHTRKFIKRNGEGKCKRDFLDEKKVFWLFDLGRWFWIWEIMIWRLWVGTSQING